MNELQIFQNTEFGELRVLEQDGKPYFPATACAKKLGYTNPQKAIRDHCKGVNEMVTPTKGGTQTMRFIPEGDLYRLITHSKLPSAERFETWIFDEVLPAIRQTGGYGNQTAALNHLVEQLTQVTASLAQVAALMVNASEGQAIAAEEPLRWRRPQSIIGRLDINIRQEVEEMICSGQHTYSDIVEHLADYGIKIGISSVWRYAKSIGVFRRIKASDT